MKNRLLLPQNFPQKHLTLTSTLVRQGYALPATLLVAGALLMVGCNSKQGGDQTPAATLGGNSDTGNVTTATTAPEPTATSAGGRSSTAAPVKPPKGFGNAQGRVLWNEKGIAGIEVSLCQNLSFINGCSGKSYTAKTDKDGNYTVDKVPPGDYGLMVRIFKTDRFIFPTDGILSAAKEHIEADKTLDIAVTNLYNTNLQITSPKAGETVRTGLPTLTWKPYEGAVNYEVELSSPSGGGESQTLKTASNSATPDVPLLNGSYEWKVSAMNANGIKIGQTSGTNPFKVTGQSGSATVNLTNPKADTTVAGSGLTFKWDANPMADSYQIYLNPVVGGQPLLSFKDVNENSYPYTDTLPAGQYYWSINAMKGGKKIASSALQSFHVK